MAHQPGAALHIPHGLANAMLLPTVMEFNRMVRRARFPVLLFRQLCKRKVPVLFALLEYITVHNFGQSVVIDAKCERVKLPVTYVPVSYTHLDVYKRQERRRPCGMR